MEADVSPVACYRVTETFLKRVRLNKSSPRSPRPAGAPSHSYLAIETRRSSAQHVVPSKQEAGLRTQPCPTAEAQGRSPLAWARLPRRSASRHTTRG